MDRKKIVIKKYENRRLYDTSNSRYVNLDEVAQAVQMGLEVQVIDAASGEDITRLVLTQIIVETAKSPNSVFPLDLLRQMVAASGRASQEGTLKYMKAIFDMYQNAYRALPPLGAFGFMPPDAGAHASDAEPIMPTSSNASSRGTGSTTHAKRDDAEVREMKRRIEELEAMVSKIGPEPSKRGRRKPKARR
jgi:polyhydroxyalkanoate synthesis repressor PhaR